jgi:hypothetical protein
MFSFFKHERKLEANMTRGELVRMFFAVVVMSFFFFLFL